MSVVSPSTTPPGRAAAVGRIKEVVFESFNSFHKVLLQA